MARSHTRGTARPLVLTWFDRNGRTLGTVGERGQYTNVTFSPDETRLAVSLTSGQPANRDIWIMDAGSGAASHFTIDPAVDATPIWSPDGTQVAFSSQRAGPYQIYAKPSTAAATVVDEALLPKPDVASVATDWSADGRFIAYTRSSATTDSTSGYCRSRAAGCRFQQSRRAPPRTTPPFLPTAAGSRISRTRQAATRYRPPLPGRRRPRPRLDEWRHATALAERWNGDLLSRRRRLGHVRRDASDWRCDTR